MAGENGSPAIGLLKTFFLLRAFFHLGRIRSIMVGAVALTCMVIVFGAMALDVSSAAAAGRPVVHGGRERLQSIMARAKRGDTVAAVLLARLYSTGQGVPQNYYEAAKWFYRAADQGNGGAQYALGMLYNKGEGVRRDYVLSYMWLNLSAAQAVGDDRDFKVRMRDAIATKMTPRQVQIAQEMAVKWSKSR
jgi:hypothetical protein